MGSSRTSSLTVKLPIDWPTCDSVMVMILIKTRRTLRAYRTLFAVEIDDVTSVDGGFRAFVDRIESISRTQTPYPCCGR